MFFVHCSRRDIAGVARSVGDAIASKDQRDRSLQHKEPRIEIMRVSVPMHVRIDFALAELIALASEVGFKFASVHRHLPFAMCVEIRRGYDELIDPQSREWVGLAERVVNHEEGSMADQADQSIELTAYDPAWQGRFAEQQARLTAILKPWLAGEVEHIGSTAVPGLRSKPIIDLLAPVRSLEAVRGAISILERDGWLFWAADPNRHYRLWFLRPNPAARTHHLHIIQQGNPNILALIAFRDALRRDPKAREAYSSLKEDLANKHRNDRDAYSNAKTEFVRSILQSRGVAPSSRKPV